MSSEPTELATVGYALVERNCNKFFSSIQRWTNDTSFNRKEATLAGAAAAGVLAAVKASAKTIAVTAIGVTLVAESLDNFQNFALFTSKPGSVQKMVRDVMEAYAKAAPANDATVMADIPTAYRYVSEYADLCTYGRIQSLIEQAITKAKPTDAGTPPAGQPAPPTGALGLPLGTPQVRRAPPNITIQ